MNRFFTDENSIIENEFIELYGEDVNHIKNVLRLKTNEEIVICDGCCRDYICRISAITSEKVVADILNICDNLSELKTRITLFQGYPKSDKLELIIQKCTELGVSRIVPVITKRTIVKLDDKKTSKKMERYRNIALSAAKQSGRGTIPEITEPVSFEEAVSMAGELDSCIIPYEKASDISLSKEIISEIKHKSTFGIFIGPEGGFDEEEIENAVSGNIVPITLGHRILRTETAGFAVMSIIMFELEEG